MAEFEAAAGPHTARQRYGRKETSALRMAVGSQFRPFVNWEEIEPMPQGRQRVARRCIESGRQGGDRDWRYRVGDGFSSSDPFLEIQEIDHAPSIGRAAPLISRLPGPQRNTIRLATSSAAIKRPPGCLPAWNRRSASARETCS